MFNWKLYACDIIVDDAWLNAIDKLSIWHSSHMWHDIDMQWYTTLHMHGNIVFHECECMVEINTIIDD